MVHSDKGHLKSLIPNIHRQPHQGQFLRAIEKQNLIVRDHKPTKEERKKFLSRRFLEMLNNLKVPILGIIENMTRNGEACRPCFEDPVHAMSRKYKVPVISSIPFISQIDRIIDTHSFFAALGYSKEQWSHLETDLIELAATGEAEPGQITEYGKKYEVRGIMKGPSGRVAEIISVWIILSGEDIPRFVTAYPGGKG